MKYIIIEIFEVIFTIYWYPWLRWNIRISFAVSRVSDFLTTLNKVTSSPLSVKNNNDNNQGNLKEEHSLGPLSRDRAYSGISASSSIRSTPRSTPSGTLDKKRHMKQSKLGCPHSLKDFLQSFSSYDKRLEISNEFNKLELEDNQHHLKEFEICQNQNYEMNRLIYAAINSLI